jgi:hypothetical protein
VLRAVDDRTEIRDCVRPAKHRVVRLLAANHMLNEDVLTGRRDYPLNRVPSSDQQVKTKVLVQ